MDKSREKSCFEKLRKALAILKEIHERRIDKEEKRRNTKKRDASPERKKKCPNCDHTFRHIARHETNCYGCGHPYYRCQLKERCSECNGRFCEACDHYRNCSLCLKTVGKCKSKHCDKCAKTFCRLHLSALKRTGCTEENRNVCCEPSKKCVKWGCECPDHVMWQIKNSEDDASESGDPILQKVSSSSEESDYSDTRGDTYSTSSSE